MLLPLPPTILLAAAGLALVTGRLLPRHTAMIWGWYFVVALVAAAGSAVMEPLTPVTTDAAIDFHRFWTNDGLANTQQWLSLLVGLVMGVPLCTSQFRKNGNWQVYGFGLFVIAGLMLVARGNDLLSAAMSLEIVTISLVALQRCAKSNPNTSAEDLPSTSTASPVGSGFRDWGHWLVSGSLWLAIVFFLNGVMTTHFDAQRLVLINSYREQGIHSPGGPSKLILLGSGLIVLSLLGRMILPVMEADDGGDDSSCRPRLSWGFHVIAGQLAASMLLSRLCGRVFAGLGQHLVVLISVACLACLFLSIVMAARGFSPGIQSIPRWLISLVLLQNAWICIGLMTTALELSHPEVRWGTFPAQTETLGVLVIVQCASVLALAGIFGSLDYLTRLDREVEFVEDVKGLGHVTPWVAITLAISLASLVGVPWTAGFWSRWWLMLSANNVHIKASSSVFHPNEGIRFLLVAATFATLCVATVVVRLIRELFFETPLSRPKVSGSRVSFIAASAAALLTLLMGTLPDVFLYPLQSIEAPLHSEPQTRPQGLGRNPSV